MRKDLARTVLLIGFTVAAFAIIWFEAFRHHCLSANPELSALFGSELRTCGFAPVVYVLLGAGIGSGWHYLTDSAGARAAA